MTVSAFFADFITQYRAYLPASSELSTYIDSVKEAVNEVESDYLRGNTKQWIEDLQAANDLGMELTRQEILEAMSSFVTEKDRIIELTCLFIRELERYDNSHGKHAVVSTKIPSQFWENSDMVMGYALGKAIALHCNPEDAAFDVFFKNLLQWLTTDNISLVIAILAFIFSMLPNSQLDKLIELQKEENTLIQRNNELIEDQHEKIDEWLKSIAEESAEKTEAINEQTEAIKENTAALEQLTEKLDADSHTTEPQQTESDEPTSCCDCACHDE